MKDNGKEDNPKNLRVGIEHRCTNCHAIKDRVETKTPYSSLVGMSMIDFFYTIDLFIMAFLIMVVIAFTSFMTVIALTVLMTTLTFSMLMITMTVTMTTHPMSQSIHHHHKRETTGNTNTNQTIHSHLRLLRPFRMRVLQCV